MHQERFQLGIKLPASKSESDHSHMRVEARAFLSNHKQAPKQCFNRLNNSRLETRGVKACHSL